MRYRYKYGTDLGGQQRNYSLREVVEESLDGGCYGRGQLEEIEKTCRNLKKTVALLLEALVEHGVPVDLKEVIDSSYERVE